MEAKFIDTDSMPHIVPAEINVDFFAAILGGDPRLAHQVVYFAPENSFYLYTYADDAFHPTTEAKLQALVSNYLIRCSQEMGTGVHFENLVTTFRDRKTLEKIVARAKALLMADQAFFTGADGRKRIVKGELVDPQAEPSYRLFVEKALVRCPDAKITVSDAFARYHTFCRQYGMNPLTRAEFKSLVADCDSRRIRT